MTISCCDTVSAPGNDNGVNYYATIIAYNNAPKSLKHSLMPRTRAPLAIG